MARVAIVTGEPSESASDPHCLKDNEAVPPPMPP